MSEPRYQIEIFARREKRAVQPQEEPWLFREIERVTGLDPAIARNIMDGGKAIEHPRYRFSRVPSK